VNKPPEPYTEPLINDIRATRERLLREHGGLRGWAEHLRTLETEHEASLISPDEFAEEQRDSVFSRRGGS
jgi:hypothetical protein